MSDSPATLYLDTASPQVSVAIADPAHGGVEATVLAQRTIELRRSSEHLLRVIEEALEEAQRTQRDLTGVVALQGPGSFTGLRIGLATALGLHQALAIRATALPTLSVLAAAAGPGPGDLVAAVDAIRGEWAIRTFNAMQGLDATGPNTAGPHAAQPERLSAAELLQRSPERIVGFGVTALAEVPGWPERGIELIEPPPLAPVAARHLTPETIDWDPARLTAPIYFRPPAVTPPKKRR
ncbi:MAG: tRNA (adenosine(37)-N6)-threonylcarbamoyltransferase complex dimerization subunit type 1 TsaB [Acidobacteriota bacterium]